MVKSPYFGNNDGIYIKKSFYDKQINYKNNIEEKVKEKLNINNDMLYLQTPKCISKQGIVSSSGKKTYIDLMFSSNDSKFIEFMENLEKSCVEKIHEKKNSWFTNDIDINDIENAFTATLRPFKAGKYYLLRANIAPSKNLVKMPTCFVFDESENSLTLDAIKPDQDLIAILEIQGIKFTARSFQFEIVLKQILILTHQNGLKQQMMNQQIKKIKTILGLEKFSLDHLVLIKQLKKKN